MSTYGATTVVSATPGLVGAAVGAAVADTEADGEADIDCEADGEADTDCEGDCDPVADVSTQLRPVTVQDDGIGDDPLARWPMRPNRTVAPGASERDQLGPDAANPLDVAVMVASQTLLTLEP